MRNTLLLIFILFPFVLFSQNTSKLTFDKTVYDLGEIVKGKEKVVVNFTFKNEGNTPLIINKVSTSCGCTIPEWSKHPIAPNGCESIKVLFNPKDISGFFQKSIFIESNSMKKLTILRIKGTIK